MRIVRKGVLIITRMKSARKTYKKKSNQFMVGPSLAIKSKTKNISYFR